jgi:glycosyltransferase involved in cell wall biosynthesis
MNSSVEITIPIFNEENTLYTQVCKIFDYIQHNLNNLSVNVILSDNGSTDRTPEIASSLIQKFPNLRYLRLDKKGVGLALKSSWTQSTADIIGYMDLDCSTDLTYLYPAFEILSKNQADIVTGSRLAKGAQVIGRSLVRNFTSRCFNYIIKILFRTSFSDGMCGFKFLKRTCLEALMNAGAQSDGWFFATELLITGEYLGYSVHNLAVVWTDDPNSKVKIGRLAIEYLKAMWLLRKRLSKKTK